MVSFFCGFSLGDDGGTVFIDDKTIREENPVEEGEGWKFRTYIITVTTTRKVTVKKDAAIRETAFFPFFSFPFSPLSIGIANKRTLTKTPKSKSTKSNYFDFFDSYYRNLLVGSG